MASFVTQPVARKERPCSRGQDTIKPGEKYVREVTAPWTRVQDDPEGGAFPLSEWYVDAYHAACSAARVASEDPWIPDGGYPPPPF